MQGYFEMPEIRVAALMRDIEVVLVPNSGTLVFLS